MASSFLIPFVLVTVLWVVDKVDKLKNRLFSTIICIFYVDKSLEKAVKLIHISVDDYSSRSSEVS